MCVCAKVFIKCQKIEHQHNLRIVQHEKQKRENTIKSSYTQIKHTGNVFLFFSLFWLQKCQKICLFHKKKNYNTIYYHCSHCSCSLQSLRDNFKCFNDMMTERKNCTHFYDHNTPHKMKSTMMTKWDFITQSCRLTWNTYNRFNVTDSLATNLRNDLHTFPFLRFFFDFKHIFWHPITLFRFPKWTVISWYRQFFVFVFGIGNFIQIGNSFGA